MKIYVLINNHSEEVGCYSTEALAYKAVEDYFNEYVNKDYFPGGCVEFLEDRCRIEMVTLIEDDE